MSGRGGAKRCTTGDEVLAAMAVDIPAELAYGEGGGDESVTFAVWRVRNGFGGEKLLRVCMTRDRLHALELGMVLPEDDDG